MPVSAAAVEVAVTGSALYAPTGTALPADAVAALNVAFLDVGYLNTDGITQGHNTSSTAIQAWQNGDVVREVITSDAVTFKFTAIESNDRARGLYFNEPAPVAGAITVKGGQGYAGVFAFEIFDGPRHTRIVVPNGQVTGWDDIAYKLGSEIGYGVTITAYPDAAGVKAYIYETVDIV